MNTFTSQRRQHTRKHSDSTWDRQREDRIKVQYIYNSVCTLEID